MRRLIPRQLVVSTHLEICFGVIIDDSSGPEQINNALVRRLDVRTLKPSHRLPDGVAVLWRIFS